MQTVCSNILKHEKNMQEHISRTFFNNFCSNFYISIGTLILKTYVHKTAFKNIRLLAIWSILMLWTLKVPGSIPG